MLIFLKIKNKRGGSLWVDGYHYPGWGKNRIRMFKSSGNKTPRDNFYLHDSTKGYSHGCIEIETQFFNDLAIFISKTGKEKLSIQVKYPSPDSSTNGGTKK